MATGDTDTTIAFKGMLVGVVLFLGGCAMSVGRMQMAWSGKTVEGMISKVSYEVTDDGFNQTPTGRMAISYTFKKEDGRRQPGSVMVKGEKWESSKAGDKIMITYLPKKPTKSEIAGQGSIKFWVILMIVGVIATVVSGISMPKT